MIAVSAALGALHAPSAHAQSAALRVESFQSPRGLVEVVGLRRWTLAMLRDSVRARSGLELDDAACATVLRESLGFADAEVTERSSLDRPGGTPERYLILKLIEPSDSGRVRWRPAAPDSFRVLRPRYAPLILGATDSLGDLWMQSILFPLQYASNWPRLAVMIEGMPEASRAPARMDGERLRAFLDAHRSDADWRHAMRALLRDGEYANRVAAATVLSSFADRDSTWLTLVEALRDPNQFVRTTALTKLRTLASRTIDWTSAIPTLRLLLGGTNVQASETVFSTLARTGLSPTLAGPLLGGNGAWVLAHLNAKHPGAFESAHALLVQLNGGEDLGRGPESWSRWISRLPARPAPITRDSNE